MSEYFEYVVKIPKAAVKSDADMRDGVRRMDSPGYRWRGLSQVVESSDTNTCRIVRVPDEDSADD